MLLAGFPLRKAGRRMETRLAVYLSGQVPGDPGSGATEAARRSVRRAQVNPLTALAARLAARLLPRGQLQRLQRKLVQAGFAGERNLAIFLATELILAALLGTLGYLLIRRFGFNQLSPPLVL